MKNYEQFSVDPSWSGLPSFYADLKKDDQHLVLIVGPGLNGNDATNKYYKAALEKNALIKSSINPNATDGALTSAVWPNGGGEQFKTVFLDWFSKDAAEVWNMGLNDTYNQVNFDGLWLDMNEATGICNGECVDGKPGNTSLFEKNKVEEEKFFFVEASGDDQFYNNTWNSGWKGQNELSTYFMPFIPGSKNLDTTTLSLNGTHPSNGLNEYDVHNLFGHLEGRVTREWLMSSSNGQ